MCISALVYCARTVQRWRQQVICLDPHLKQLRLPAQGSLPLLPRTGQSVRRICMLLAAAAAAASLRLNCSTLCVPPCCSP